MLGCWEWLIGGDKQPLVMTKFGDWFLTDPQGQVYWLDLLEGACTQVAAFEQLMVQEEQLDHWFMLPWCYALHDDGQVPGEDQCFGFKIPPRLGAPVELANVEVANLMSYQVWMAEIAKIPPGTKVDAITVNGKLP